MAFRIDARLPVHLAGPEDGHARASDHAFLLVEQGLDPAIQRGALAFREAAFAPDHDTAPGSGPPACACCTGRPPFATALATLFHDRAKGTAPFFAAVHAVGSPRGLAHARAALATDPFLLARYRMAGGLG